MTRISTLCAAATATALSLLASPALAAPVEVTVLGQRPGEMQLQERVSYADLNLASAAGEETLERRVNRAVKSVCAPHIAGQSVLSHNYNRCRDFARAGAQPQMDRAIQRARDIAANGVSSIPPVAIAISGAFEG